MSGYGHAALLAARCARGCAKIPFCVSEVDGRMICGDCAYAELGPVGA